MKAVLLVPGNVRAERAEPARAGILPRDFFYGTLGLARHGYELAFADTRADPTGLAESLLLRYDMLRNRLTRVGYSPRRFNAIAPQLADAAVAISPTDGFTMSLGLGMPRGAACRIAGGFMGMSDLAERARPGLRGLVKSRIARAIDRLDHVFFFSEADRQGGHALYGIDPARTSLFRFGVDTDFWCPAETARDIEILSVGSDPSRDYASLLGAGIDAGMTIITRLPVDTGGNPRVTIINGSYGNSPIDDAALRDLYRRARVVVVPVEDVWQPSGQSVTMQAMACGRPVVVTRNRGFWGEGLLHSGGNCILVPPRDRLALRDAVHAVLGDAALADRLGRAAREASVDFSIEAAEASMLSIVNAARAATR